MFESELSTTELSTLEQDINLLVEKVLDMKASILQLEEFHKISPENQILCHQIVHLKATVSLTERQLIELRAKKERFVAQLEQHKAKQNSESAPLVSKNLIAPQ